MSVLGDGVPLVRQLRPSRQLILETTEGAAADERAIKLFARVRIVEAADEPLHVAVAVS
jgi:hypothetical protein